jgi:DNA-binding beta-propeller fold protein YncE
MTVEGTYKYDVLKDWGRGPTGRKLGVINGIAVDSHDHVYIATRKPVPCVMVFNREGDFLQSWGEDVFVTVGGIHGISISSDDEVFTTDCLDHTVHKFTTDGQLIMTIGTRGQIGEPGLPFNRPTRAVAGPSGDIFVSDGYGQSRIHRFSPEGELLCSWGAPGTGPGEFDTPHAINVDRLNRVLVADRANGRVQVFDAEGNYLSEWPTKPPNDIYIDQNDNIFAGDCIFNLDGERIAQSDEIFCHALCGDSHGDIYWSTVGYADVNGQFVEASNKLKKLVRL